jgi:hypothetical protein
MDLQQTRRERRAAERKAKKLELKKQRLADLAGPTPEEDALLDDIANGRFPDPCESLPEPAEDTQPASISEARLAANRANALLSTGPKSPTGKASSSRNATTTGMTTRDALLPNEDADAYHARLADFRKLYKPAGPLETALVQSIADTTWRLARVPRLEAAILTAAEHTLAAECVDQNPLIRDTMISAKAFLANERQLRNLYLQEARLRRQRDKDIADLHEAQKIRNKTERDDLEVAAKLYLAAQHDRRPFHPADHGFDFSNSDIEDFLKGVRAARIAHSTLDRDAGRAVSAGRRS